MDDLLVFENFLSTQCGLTVNRARDETVEFIHSFTTLLYTSDAEIDNFVKSTHATNSARPENGKVMIPIFVIFDFKALRFKLEDRARCGALPVLVTLQSLDAVKLNYMHDQRTNNVVDKANFSALRKLPDITVPKFMAYNYDIFSTALCYVSVRTIGMNGISIDYAMCGVTGNYDSHWMNW